MSFVSAFSCLPHQLYCVRYVFVCVSLLLELRDLCTNRILCLHSRRHKFPFSAAIPNFYTFLTLSLTEERKKPMEKEAKVQKVDTCNRIENWKEIHSVSIERYCLFCNKLFSRIIQAFAYERANVYQTVVQIVRNR